MPGACQWSTVSATSRSKSGDAGPRGPRAGTWGARGCSIDGKCIDQDSDADKAYWIPRMHEVYREARCTVLPLRNGDLTPLPELAQEMSCRFKGEAVFHGRVVGTAHLPAEPERHHVCARTGESMPSLTSFTSGPRGRRACLLQEALSPENYLPSREPARRMRRAGVLFHRCPGRACVALQNVGLGADEPTGNGRPCRLHAVEPLGRPFRS